MYSYKFKQTKELTNAQLLLFLMMLLQNKNIQKFRYRKNILIKFL